MQRLEQAAEAGGHCAWKCSRTVEMWHWGMWLVGMVGVGQWLDMMLLEVLSSQLYTFSAAAPGLVCLIDHFVPQSISPRQFLCFLPAEGFCGELITHHPPWDHSKPLFRALLSSLCLEPLVLGNSISPWAADSAVQQTGNKLLNSHKYNLLQSDQKAYSLRPTILNLHSSKNNTHLIQSNHILDEVTANIKKETPQKAIHRIIECPGLKRTTLIM